MYLLAYMWSVSHLQQIINHFQNHDQITSKDVIRSQETKKSDSHDFEHWTLHGADCYRLRGVIRNVSYKADCWGYKWKSCHISRVNSKFSFPEHALPSCLFPGTSVVKEKKQLWGTTTVYVHELGLLY